MQNFIKHSTCVLKFVKMNRNFMWNRNFAWLTPTGIQFPNGPWVSGMEISSSRGLKKTLKLALGMKRLTSRGPTALGRKALCKRKIVNTRRFIQNRYLVLEAIPFHFLETSECTTARQNDIWQNFIPFAALKLYPTLSGKDTYAN